VAEPLFARHRRWCWRPDEVEGDENGSDTDVAPLGMVRDRGGGTTHGTAIRVGRPSTACRNPR
jgi:hypothetical protein